MFTAVVVLCMVAIDKPRNPEAILCHRIFDDDIPTFDFKVDCEDFILDYADRITSTVASRPRGPGRMITWGYECVE